MKNNYPQPATFRTKATEKLPSMIPAGFMTETLRNSYGLDSDLMFQNLKNMCTTTLFNLDSKSDLSEAAVVQVAEQPPVRVQKKRRGLLDRLIFGNRFKLSLSASEKMLRRADDVARILRNKEDFRNITFEDYFNYLLWIPLHMDIREETITMQFFLDALAIFILEVKKSTLGNLHLVNVESRDVEHRYFNLRTCFMQVVSNSLSESETEDRYKRVSNSILFYVLLHAEIVNGIQMNFAVDFGSNGLLEVKA